MPRADLILQLVESGSKGDKALFRKTVEAVIAEERAKNHKILADKIEENMKNIGVDDRNTQPFYAASRTENRIDNLLYETVANTSLNDLVLSNDTKRAINELIEEQHRSDILRSYGLEPRHRILLVGPPGNGKTSLAEAIAYQAAIPLYSIRYEGIIGSYLGETSSRLKSLFDFIRTQRCVVFFDEFDTIGKERGDVHETGEIKRVVSTLLLQIDRLPSYAIVVAATNHPELLDRAVWRRFQVKIPVDPPKDLEIVEFLSRFERQYKIEFGYQLPTLAKQLTGSSYSELQDFCQDAVRRYVLSFPTSKNLKTITKSALEQRQSSYKPNS